MRMLMLALTVFGTAAADGANQVGRKTMPAAFHGNWVLETRDCVVGASNNGAMRIEPRKVTLFEKLGKVSRVTVENPNTVYVYSRIIHNNTAYNSVETSENLEKMSLSPDGQRLTTGEDEVMLVYKRCAK
jgi:hypothetical protein